MNTFVGYYLGMNTNNTAPGDRCRIISPMFLDNTTEKCLTFTYKLSGKHAGALHVFDQDGNVLWKMIGCIILFKDIDAFLEY